MRFSLKSAAALVAATCVAAAPAAASPCRGSHWVGAWGTAPSTTGAAYADQTVRLVVNVHRGGARLRLRVSNRFGAAPLEVDRVTVARRLSGPRLVAGSLRAVRFGGRRGLTVPRGAEALSDPVRLRFSAFSDLAVSFYLRGPSGPSTVHPVANEPASYTAAGDHTADGEGFGPPTQAWPYLTGIDVRAARRVGTLVAFGDSITDGFQSPRARPPGVTNTRWPDFLARRLAARRSPLSVVNTGISGNRLRLDGFAPIYGPSALTRLDDDVLSVPGARTAIVLEGINDIGQPPPATPGQVIDGLRRVIARLRRAGLRVLAGTLTPSGGDAEPTYGSAEANDRRIAVNRWIRSSGLPDGVIDFDAAVRDPTQPGRLRPAYDSGDHLHPNARGYRRMAAAVPLARLGGGGCRR
jgi:lysophospholipase L1-like esterase